MSEGVSLSTIVGWLWGHEPEVDKQGKPVFRTAPRPAPRWAPWHPGKAPALDPPRPGPILKMETVAPEMPAEILDRVPYGNERLERLIVELEIEHRGLVGAEADDFRAEDLKRLRAMKVSERNRYFEREVAARSVAGLVMVWQKDRQTAVGNA